MSHTSKNKPKFTTKTEDHDSVPTPREPVPLGIMGNPMVAGFLQTVGGVLNIANTNLVNGMINQVGQTLNGVLTSISEHPFLQNDTNRGWVLIGGAIFGAFFLISMLWQFIFSFMLTYASVKVILWFLEHYEPDNSTDEIVGDSYVSESSPVDVMEYIVVLLFLMTLTFFSYFPYMSLIVNVLCVLLAITTLASKDYRRKLCNFVHSMLVSSDYMPGKGMEGKIHASLQTFCYTIETLNIGTFNMASNSRAIITDLKSSTSLSDGIKRLSRRPTQVNEKTLKRERDAKKKKNDDYEDDLDEQFD